MLRTTLIFQPVFLFLQASVTIVSVFLFFCFLFSFFFFFRLQLHRETNQWLTEPSTWVTTEASKSETFCRCSNLFFFSFQMVVFNTRHFSFLLKGSLPKTGHFSNKECSIGRGSVGACSFCFFLGGGGSALLDWARGRATGPSSLSRLTFVITYEAVRMLGACVWFCVASWWTLVSVIERSIQAMLMGKLQGQPSEWIIIGGVLKSSLWSEVVDASSVLQSRLAISHRHCQWLQSRQTNDGRYSLINRSRPTSTRKALLWSQGHHRSHLSCF